MVVETSAQAAEADAGAAANTASSNQRDQQGQGVSSLVSDNDKDTGADERVESFGATVTEINTMNLKRTADQYQSVDTAELVAAQSQRNKLSSIEVRSAEQTMLHQAKMNSLEVAEREATRRHQEDNHTVRVMALAGFVNDAVVESFADNIAKQISNMVVARTAGGE